MPQTRSTGGRSDQQRSWRQNRLTGPIVYSTAEITFSLKLMCGRPSMRRENKGGWAAGGSRTTPIAWRLLPKVRMMMSALRARQPACRRCCADRRGNHGKDCRNPRNFFLRTQYGRRALGSSAHECVAVDRVPRYNALLQTRPSRGSRGGYAGGGRASRSIWRRWFLIRVCNGNETAMALPAATAVDYCDRVCSMQTGKEGGAPQTSSGAAVGRSAVKAGRRRARASRHSRAHTHGSRVRSRAREYGGGPAPAAGPSLPSRHWRRSGTSPGGRRG